MDITDQILDHHRRYGSSDFTAQFATASSRALNYANGASIQRPEQERVTNIPRQLSYQDSVGLFGSENHFIKVTTNVQNPVAACYEEPGWECARISNEVILQSGEEDDYIQPNAGYDQDGQAFIDKDADQTVVNTFEPAKFIENTAYRIPDSFVRVDLNNLKTGNKYVDSWLDVRLYKKNRDEHPYDVLYVGTEDYFYIGFHARNTRRLAYNVSCMLGVSSEGNDDGYLRIEDIPEELLNLSL